MTLFPFLTPTLSMKNPCFPALNWLWKLLSLGMYAVTKEASPSHSNPAAEAVIVFANCAFIYPQSPLAVGK